VNKESKRGEPPSANAFQALSMNVWKFPGSPRLTSSSFTKTLGSFRPMYDPAAMKDNAGEADNDAV
jgi:hypothetical protein